jgi:putative acetyltransferase
MQCRIEREDPRQADVAALIAELDAMMRRLYPPQSNHLLDIDALADASVHFFVARREGVALGCGALWHRDPEYGEIKRIFVKPEARGLKIGRALLHHLEASARAHGLPVLRLETGTLQPEALALFTAEGFMRRGPFADYPPDDPYSIFMEKRL